MKDKELEHFEMYVKYCNTYSRDPQQFQMLLANSRINRYFNKEYKKKEKEAIKTLKSVTSKKDKLHDCLMQEVLEYHSPMIIKKESQRTKFYIEFLNLN
jgi:hypothetical protein